MVSMDGVNWKSFDQFETMVSGGVGADEALANTATARPAQLPQQAPSATVTQQSSSVGTRPSKSGSQPASGPVPRRGTVVAARTGPSSTTTSERKRGSDADSDRSPPPRRSGQSAVAQLPRSHAGDHVWPMSIAFMCLGVIVGGASVYFALYLLGFYDLTSPF